MTLICGLFITNQNKAYAIECNSEVVGDDMDEYTYDNTVCAYKPKLTSTETVTITNGTSPTASLKIDNSAEKITDKVNSSYGITNYASHTVSVSVTEAGSYSLILSGPAQLSGPSTINATSGATGANLANDTWGYAWENTNVTNENANYKALSSNVALTGNPTLSNKSASFSKKLAFAAKFDKASAGTYHADIKLSLIATPEVTTTTVQMVPWDKMVYMQDMTSYACDSVAVGATKTLTDIRSNNTDYTIAKLSDGKCWMTQNLRFSDSTRKSGIRSLTTFDTNLPEKYNGAGGSYPVPYTPTFSSTDPAGGQIRPATDNTYGAYYSFNAATAGTMNGKEGTTQYDICPKGWRLPTGDDAGDFATLQANGSVKNGNWNSDFYGRSTYGSGYWFGSVAIGASGGTFFPAAGLTTSSVIAGVGTEGHYWCNSAYTTGYACNLYINKESTEIVNSPRYFGYSIRCIAK